MFWGFDSEGTQGKSKPSAQSKPAQMSCSSLEELRKGEKKEQNRKKKVFSKMLLLSILDLTDTLIQLMCSLARQQHMNTYHKW